MKESSGRNMAPSPLGRNGNGMRSPIGRSRLAGTEHPIEVVGRIRQCPGGGAKDKAIQVLQGQGQGHRMRVRTDLGYRDFRLDGVSDAQSDGLSAFYKKFVQARVDSVKAGGKCTVMMYGPTGSGKSHTMFGCSAEPGIVYRALDSILGGNEHEEKAKQVNVSVLEIYNEEIYDLLATNASKINGCRARLEVMGRKVKNAVFISGSNAVKIANEVAKVEKRRVVKNTLYNDRSSRSHCLITLDVPAVGGRLMLVDMAGSENIDQSGFAGFEAKLQTAKINQGNIALKRVVEAIANGDTHVPFRDSRLTMLLQDSFEDNGTKILMVLCASPDPRDIHKTIGTLEYGAKAKCIVRCSSSPSKEKVCSQGIDSTVLGARIVAMDEYISKLQIDNKLKEEEREAAQNELLKKEEEVTKLRAKLQEIQEKQSEKQKEIELKVEEKARLLKLELIGKFEECQKSANIFVELGERKMEQKILQQEEEVEMLRHRLEEIESELKHIKSTPFSNNLVRMDASIKNERIPDNVMAVDSVSSSMRVLEGMHIQQEKKNLLSPSEKVHVEVFSGDKMKLNSLDFPSKSNRNKPDNLKRNTKLDSKDQYGENLTIVDDLALLSDNVSSSFCTLNKDEKVLIHQRFPFLKLNSTDSTGSGHNSDMEEEDYTEPTRSMERGRLSTVYEEEETNIRDDEVPEEEVTSRNRNCITSEFAKTQITSGCNAEGKTLGYFEPKLQQASCLPNSTKFPLDNEVEKRDSENQSGSLNKPVIFEAETNLNNGNTITRSLGGSEHQTDETVSRKACIQNMRGSEHHIDATVSRKTRIQNIFLLCGNSRELAQQARNTPPHKQETSKGTRAGSSWNSTTFFDEPIENLSPEVAGLVTPSCKSSSPQYAKLTLWSPSLEGNTRFELKYPRLFTTVETELGVPTSNILILNNQNKVPLTEETCFQQVVSGKCHRDDQIKQHKQSKENDKTQVEEDDKCDVHVEWETLNGASRKLLQIIKTSKSTYLTDLRKMIEPHIGEKQEFIFLMLGDPNGAPVSRENEASIQITSLPDCQNQCNSRLACLRKCTQCLRNPQEMPLNSLENKLPLPSSKTCSNSCIQTSNCSPATSNPPAMTGYKASLLKGLRL
ncbi:hypothetical protein SUGI_0832070 [Cryptomeria japonica]|uniref:kinesin-like protein KIN-10A n=1 Tax=Cryptomeria japonica TaxID=3369 RepID=UPI002414A718|nr:kinesin-like protein KIN-10A [Cryptomeria japonica]GLJ40406.1 hypothetical protein SUGI_0832070 [Cryptomeria japonica]